MSGARAYIGFGANLGDMQNTLTEAAQALANAPGVYASKMSRLYRSDPVDAPGPSYINAVLEIHTGLAPLPLLGLLQRIETQFGRQRHFRNAPRTLDLDLLLYDELSFRAPTLTVPHPRMHLRAFVLKPLSELTGDNRRVNGRTLTQWLADCQAQPCAPLIK